CAVQLSPVWRRSSTTSPASPRTRPRSRRPSRRCSRAARAAPPRRLRPA
ncbi:MAG: hypothetical protein AVDCRST_MAG36-2004, partial [uncultured Nocardioidaceae bacterium]